MNTYYWLYTLILNNKGLFDGSVVEPTVKIYTLSTAHSVNIQIIKHVISFFGDGVVIFFLFPRIKLY